jgi:lysophospholipase L1-like esterase
MKSILPIVLLLFAIATWDTSSWRWSFFSLTLFALPLFRPHRFTFSLAAFLILQILVGAVKTSDYKTLMPGLNELTAMGNRYRGITGWQHLTTDAEGFRVTRPIRYDQAAGYRIFVVGGSTTEQILLDDHKTWTAELERQLNADGQDVQVINTGVSGLRARHHVATLEHISALHPSMVVFVMGANDWIHHIFERFDSSAAPPPPAWREKLSLRHSPLGTLLTRSARGWFPSPQANRHSEAPRYDERRHSLERQPAHTFFPDRVSDEYSLALTRLGEICHRANFGCVFVDQPHGYQASANAEYRASFWMTPPYRPYTLTFDSLVSLARLYNETSLTFAKRNGFATCAVADRIDPSFASFYDDMHFNESGAKMMGSLLADCLRPLIQNRLASLATDLHFSR